jgi:hypothetical protein
MSTNDASAEKMSKDKEMFWRKRIQAMNAHQRETLRTEVAAARMQHWIKRQQMATNDASVEMSDEMYTDDASAELFKEMSKEISTNDASAEMSKEISTNDASAREQLRVEVARMQCWHERDLPHNEEVARMQYWHERLQAMGPSQRQLLRDEVIARIKFLNDHHENEEGYYSAEDDA